METSVKPPSRAGTLYGLLGMVSFSLTLPATRAAVIYFDPWVVALGRPVIAGVLAALLLIVTRQRPPERRYWKNFVLVIAGVVIGVPLLFAWGMANLPASHGAITLALLPMATTLLAVLRAGERPSVRFWIACAVGSVAVFAFAVDRGLGRLRWGDMFLFLSVLASAIGYTEGARLSRVFAGWQVVSWALVFGLPFLIVPLVFVVKKPASPVPSLAWCSFAYVCVVSQFTGLFVWYKGLAAGGISKIGQLQLLQPFCTFAFSVLLLGESITVPMLVTAAVVVASVAVARKAPVKMPDRHAAKELASR